MRAMNIHGLTLHHLKSHLQKFRLGKSQQLQPYQDDKQGDHRESPSHLPAADRCDEAEGQMNENTQIARALQMQMEVQRKLHEQIEVQRHLQLRIEAQGKYLQSVMKKAQETLAGYGSCTGVELGAKAELSKLVSMAEMGGCLQSSSMSVLTEKEGSVTKETENKHMRSSSPSSSESSGRMERSRAKQEAEDDSNKSRGEDSIELSLMEMHPTHNASNDQARSGRKRSQSTSIPDNTCVQKPSDKIFKASSTYDEHKLKKYGFLENLDLNAKCLSDFDTGPKVIDLNSNGVEQFNGYS
ncbi:PREDICTED: myb family transcription factor PHL8-like isoform X2 [Ipomoea nil]|nr:PREDICTED: myb family transcription factor PHL8-like isoform X2 [Ipomoea nil]